MNDRVPGVYIAILTLLLVIGILYIFYSYKTTLVPAPQPPLQSTPQSADEPEPLPHDMKG